MNEGPEILKTIAALSYVGLFGISFMANVLVPVPEEVVILAIGYVAGTGTINFWITLGVVIAGTLLCDCIMFMLSRRNNPLVKGFYDKFFSKIFPINQDSLKKHIGKVIFFSRFMVQLRFLGPFLAGQAHVSWKKFLAHDVPAVIIYISALMWAGHYFEDKIDRIFSGIHMVKNIFIVIALIAIAWFVMQAAKKFFLGYYVISFKKGGVSDHKKTWVPGLWKVVKKEEAKNND